MSKIFRTYQNNLASILVSSLILILGTGYQISPLVFKDYNSICSVNYGTTPEFTRCMNPYYSQLGINQFFLIASIIVFLITGIFWILKKLQK